MSFSKVCSLMILTVEFPACREFGHGAALALAEGGQLPCGKAVGAGGAVGFLKFALFG